MVAVEGLAQHDIFVTIMAEPLVERMVEHDIATDEEIGRVEMLIGRRTNCLLYLLQTRQTL